MKRKIALLALALCCLLVLSACGCSHEEWTEADCENPKTCVECGETEGSPLGHSWIVASCETAKTCEVCGKTEGEPLGHSWVDATCDTPKTCSTCSLTEGDPLDHQWQDATTEAPKTCAVCAATEGERIVTDPRFTTAANQHAFGLWQCTLSLTGEMMELEGFNGTFDCLLNLELNNDGTMIMGLSLADPDAFQESMVQYVVDTTYAELEASGYSKEQANEAMQTVYNMTIEEFAQTTVNSFDFNSIFEQFSMEGVYYVDGTLLYSGTDWDNMSSEEVSFEDDVMIMSGGIFDEAYTVFNRVTE